VNENELFGNHKLTRKFFMSLPEGVYVVSNCCDALGPGRATPVFHEYVARREERPAQWDQIRAVGADQRLCDIYRSVEDCKNELESRTAQSSSYPSIVIFERNDDAKATES